MRWAGLEPFDKELLSLPNFTATKIVEDSRLCVALPPCLDASLGPLVLPSKRS
jgi:hypothetical protein